VMSHDVSKILESLSTLAATSNGRNVDRLAAFLVADFKRACSELANASGRVLLTTGFTIKNATPPAPETDGPLGAVILGAVLASLGRSVTVICDATHEPVIDAACNAVNKILAVQRAPRLEIFSATATDLTEDGEGLPSESLGELVDESSALVFIERVGPGSDGHCRNMRGEPIDHLTLPLHRLLDTFGGLSIGVGDGGNEVGFGRLSVDALGEFVQPPEIACLVPTDCLIVAGVSNWGAHALAAGISCFMDSHEQRALGSTFLAEDVSAEVVDRMTDAGAVDGMTGLVNGHIDGLDWPCYWKVPDRMNGLLTSLEE
jgi:hypothetical protein